MTMRKNSIFFRAIILGAQGVFYNLFCTYISTIYLGYSANSFCSPCIPYVPKIGPPLCGLLGRGGSVYIVHISFSFPAL